MSRDEAFRQCIDAFAAGDYASCVQHAWALVREGPTLYTLQLLLIGLQRLGREGELDDLGPKVLDMTAGHPWDQALLRLTLGQAEPQEVLERAADEEQLCQAMFYLGARELTLGGFEEATRVLAASAAQKCDCLERLLAQYELARESTASVGAPTRDMEQRMRVLNQHAQELSRQGKYAEALEPARQVCELARHFMGEDHLATAVCLSNLGVLMQKTGDLAAARPHMEQSLEIVRRLLGDDQPGTLNSLQTLCDRLHKMGELAVARPYLEQPLESLCDLLHEMGDLPGARPYLEQCLAIRRRVLGEDHPDTVTSLKNLADLLEAMGDLAGALPYMEQTLEINRRVLGDDHPDTVRSLHNLGVVLGKMGDVAGARLYLEQALEINRRVLGNDHLCTVLTLQSLGTLLSEMGDMGAALDSNLQALQIARRVLGDDHPATALSFNNVGDLLTDMGDLERAGPCLASALEISRRVLGESRLTIACLNNLARLFRAMGNLRSALKCYTEAIEIVPRVLGDDPDTVILLNNIGNFLREAGDLAMARSYLELAMADCRRMLGDDHPHAAKSLDSLGRLDAASGRFDEALALMRQAAAIDNRTIGRIFSIGSDRQRLLFLGQLQGHQDCFLSLVYRHQSQSPEAVRMAFDLVLCRKALGAEALAAQRDAVLGERYPHLREAFDQLTQLRRRIAQKTLAGPAAGETIAAHEQTLEQWRQEQQECETALARQIPELTLEQQLHKADRRAVALALPEGVALVEFVRFDVFDFHAVPARGEPKWQPARYLAFVLPAGQPDEVQMIDLGEADPIDQLIADFRAGVAADPHDRTDRDVCRRPAGAPHAAQGQAGPTLRAALFDKLMPALGGRTRLLLAPDGDLARLPFEVLPDAEGRLLLEQYGMSYLGCGRDVLRFGAAPTRPPAGPLVVGDPLFDLAAGAPAAPASAPTPPSRCSRDIRHSGYHFRRLPGTREEGERVGDLLGVRPWLGSDALEGRLKQARSPRVLHLATHGFFLEDQPHDPNKESLELARAGAEAGTFGRLAGALPENPLLRSGLALAGAQTWLDGAALPEEAEDGLLTAEDVTGLDLLDTQLVVLSACETGLGEVHTGEGVLGLRRAFVVAGARTLVVSLWKVPDEQTRELMVDFYSRVLSGQGVADALRQAQLALRERHPDPYFWGAFVCQGDPGPLGAGAHAPPARPDRAD